MICLCAQQLSCASSPHYLSCKLWDRDSSTLWKETSLIPYCRTVPMLRKPALRKPNFVPQWVHVLPKNLRDRVSALVQLKRPGFHGSIHLKVHRCRSIFKWSGYHKKTRDWPVPLPTQNANTGSDFLTVFWKIFVTSLTDHDGYIRDLAKIKIDQLLQQVQYYI